MKRSFLLFSLIFISFFGLQGDDPQVKHQNASEKYVIGVDLHDTYLQRDLFGFITSVMGILAHAPNKLQLMALLFRVYPLINKALEINKKPEVSGSARAVLEELTISYPALKTIKEDILQLVHVALHKPNQEMVTLVNDLKAAGYRIVVVSNITQEGLDSLKAINPEAFWVFDDYFYSDYPRQTDIKGEKIVIPKKPDTGYFKILSEKVLHNQPMIFIDDRQDFIDGAKNAYVNIQGILFKNAQQVRQELEKMEILKSKERQQEAVQAVN